MIARIPFCSVYLAAFALASFCLPKVSAQTLAPLQNEQAEEPLQMIIGYGDGTEKRRVSHHGVMEPVGFPAGQPVAITLRFLRKRAGEAVEIISQDGGQVDLQAPAAISEDGALTFTFQPGSTPGLYRLTVNGPHQYQVSLYAVDPNQPHPRTRN